MERIDIILYLKLSLNLFLLKKWLLTDVAIGHTTPGTSFHHAW